MTAYVDVDLHRRRSLAVSLDAEGDRLWWRRFENSPLTMAEVVAEAGPAAEVVLEATWGSASEGPLPTRRYLNRPLKREKPPPEQGFSVTWS